MNSGADVLRALEGPAAIVTSEGVVVVTNRGWAEAEAPVGVITGVGSAITAPRVFTLLRELGKAELTEANPTGPRSLDTGAAQHTYEVRVTALGDHRLVTVRDLTRLRDAEDRLRASNSRLRSIIAGAPIVLLGLDAEGVFTVVEGVGGSGLGATPELLLGRSIFEAYAHVTPLVDAFRRARDGELVVTRFDVSLMTFEVQFTPNYDAAGKLTHVVGVASDISERTRIERMKNEFVSVVSHELRTPLTSIRGSLGLLEGGVVGELPDKAKKLVTIARSNADRLIRLINDILDLDKLEAGRLEFQSKRVAARDLLRRCAEALGGMAAEAGVTIVHSATDLEVTGDEERLLQVLVNFTSNAIKFSPEGGEVRLLARPLGDQVRFEVIDQGPGIPDELRDRLFRKFEQLQSPMVRKSGGSGLGLAISKAIVDAHHGRIGVDSEPGRGSSFFFAMARRGSSREAAPESKAAAMRGRTVEIDVGQVRDPSHVPAADRIRELVEILRDVTVDDTPALVDAHAQASVLRATLSPDAPEALGEHIGDAVWALERVGLRASGDAADVAAAREALTAALALTSG